VNLFKAKEVEERERMDSPFVIPYQLNKNISS